MAFLGAMVVAMFRFDPASVAVEENIEGVLGLKVGIGMQFVNGKEWAFVIIMMSQFIEPLGGGMTGIATIIFVTLTMCLGAMILWTCAGARLNHLFTEGTTGKAHLPDLRVALGAVVGGLPGSRASCSGGMMVGCHQRGSGGHGSERRGYMLRISFVEYETANARCHNSVTCCAGLADDVLFRPLLSRPLGT